MKKSFFRVCSIIILIILLANPTYSFEGASKGLLLWAQIVLPTLLPFMICSSIIVSLDAISLLIFPFRFLLRSVFYLSDAGSYILISGLLCGYPMGAKTCSEFIDQKYISTKEGRYLLSICNHPSPMFLLGYMVSQLSLPIPLPLLLIPIYLPILPVSYLARRYYGIHRCDDVKKTKNSPSLSFDESLMSCFEVMVKIGGYIMLFSILAVFIVHLPIPSSELKAIVLGIIEITTGIPAISTIRNQTLMISAILAVTAFGGLSGIFQTKSVLKNAGLSIRHYVFWKGLHSLLSVLIFLTLWVFVVPAR